MRTRILRAVSAMAISLALMAQADAQTPLPPPYNYDEPLPAAPRPAPAPQDMRLGAGKQTYRMPVYANRKLAGPLDDVRRVVVMLPDDRGDADRHYQHIDTLLQRDAERRADTLVLALEFPGVVDTGHAGRPAWRKAAWQNGGLSVRASGRPGPVGAFQVLDDLLGWLADRQRLPMLAQVVLAGHSGGAQLLQRYAILNNADGPLRQAGLAIRYVIANAPSYLYLGNERPRRRGAGFEPYERGICPTYNQYPYGPQNLPPYAAGADPASLFVRYARRDVVYLLGSADTNPEAHGLDQRCGAEAQGSTRLSRGQGYLRYDRLLASRGARQQVLRHEHQQVAGVGHDAGAMFGSLCGTRALLGDAARVGQQAATCRPVDP
ncbi:hypothetical protein CAL18_11065 [Bordetella genomosp. 7]|nr:hypothetical protein CAL18_11065 [Bordetella genomosp. 7]